MNSLVHIDYIESKNLKNISISNDVNPMLNNISHKSSKFGKYLNSIGRQLIEKYKLRYYLVDQLADPMIRKLIERSQIDGEDEKAAILNLLTQSGFTDSDKDNLAIAFRTDSDTDTVKDSPIAADLKVKATIPTKHHTLHDSDDYNQFKTKFLHESKIDDITSDIGNEYRKPQRPQSKMIVNPESDDTMFDSKTENGENIKPKIKMIFKSVSESEVENDLHINLGTPTKLHIDKTHMPIEISKSASEKMAGQKLAKEKLKVQMAGK